jgi:putative redox protein
MRALPKQQNNMEVTLESIHGDLNFKGTNDRGQSVEFSGNKESVSPMETVLMAAAACSSIDIELILKKMRQQVTDIKVKVKSVRAETDPKVFTQIHMHYTVTGDDLKDEKVAKAIDMSMGQYCSVSIMLARATEITTSYDVIDIGLNGSM